MTKRVRIENADNSKYNVIVQAWKKGLLGGPDVLFREEHLDYPTALTTGLVYKEQYPIIKEDS